MTQHEISAEVNKILKGFEAAMAMLDGNMAQAYVLIGVAYAKLDTLAKQLETK